ncbi:hypothetical protein J2T17_004394 [Paenibacillus mucilaginosus]
MDQVWSVEAFCVKKVGQNRGKKLRKYFVVTNMVTSIATIKNLSHSKALTY